MHHFIVIAFAGMWAGNMKKSVEGIALLKKKRAANQ